MAQQEFLYEALDEEGKRITGTILADSKEIAREILLDRGILATSLKAQRKSLRKQLSSLLRLSVPSKDIILFSKQFHTLLASGVSLTEILGILHDQAENERLREALEDISKRISEGESLYGTFSRHNDVFPPLYCAMIRAGESSGALAEVFDRLSSMLAHEEKVKNQITEAVRYPKMVVGAIVVAFVVLLNFVIPQFAAIFKAAKIELPLPTQIAIAMNEAMSDWWYVFIPSVVGGWYLLSRWLKTPSGKRFKDSLVLCLPIVGPVVQKSMLARFAAIFSLLQRSGVSVFEAIDILAATLDNKLMEEQFAEAKEKMAAGQGLSGPFSQVRYFTPLAVNMIRIGESSGNLSTMMDELTNHYDEEVEFAIGRLTEAIGPILLVALGVVVLFFALAIFMPMWDMGKLAM